MTLSSTTYTTSAAIRAHGAEEWQDISSAPKGELLLYFPRETGRNAMPAMMRVERYPVTFPRQPTHWMPLPTPPIQTIPVHSEEGA